MNWPPQYGQQPQQPPPNGAQPQGAPGPYQPPGQNLVQVPGQGAPPPGYGAAPTYPQGAPPPGYGAAPTYPQGAPPPGYGAPPPGYGAAPTYPQGAPPPGYGAPPPGYGAAPTYPQGAPPPGYGAAPAQGYGPTTGGPIAFIPQVMSLDTFNDPDLPAGSHILVGTGEGGSAAQGKMFRVELRVERSQNQQVIGAIGNYKVWLERPNLKGGPKAWAEAASKEFALFAVPASGRQFKDTDLQTANNLVHELVSRMTVEGRPLNQIRIGADVTVHPNKKKPGETYTRVVFQVLPPGA